MFIKIGVFEFGSIASNIENYHRKIICPAHTIPKLREPIPSIAILLLNSTCFMSKRIANRLNRLRAGILHNIPKVHRTK